MNQAAFERWLRWVLCGILLVLVVFFAGRALQNYREYRHFREREAAMLRQLDDLRAEYRMKQRYLRRLMDDPVFLEDVVRERLGYIRTDEQLFRFPSREDRR